MFETRKLHTMRAIGSLEVLRDLDDRWDGFARLSEELQTNRAHTARHAMHDPACCRDQTVAPFLLDARKATEEFVRHVFAEACFAE